MSTRQPTQGKQGSSKKGAAVAVSISIIIPMILVAMFGAGLFVTQDDGPTPGARSVSPFTINGNVELASFASSGSGTSNDPYIIGNIEVHQSDRSLHAVAIVNTNAHLIIRNVSIYGGANALHLNHAHNIRVEHSDLQLSYQPLAIGNSFNVHVDRVKMSSPASGGSDAWGWDNHLAVSYQYVSASSITNCDIVGFDYAMNIRGVYSLDIAGNYISDCHAGLLIHESRGPITISGNYISVRSGVSNYQGGKNWGALTITGQSETSLVNNWFQNTELSRIPTPTTKGGQFTEAPYLVMAESKLLLYAQHNTFISVNGKCIDRTGGPTIMQRNNFVTSDINDKIFSVGAAGRIDSTEMFSTTSIIDITSGTITGHFLANPTSSATLVSGGYIYMTTRATRLSFGLIALSNPRL